MSSNSETDPRVDLWPHFRALADMPRERIDWSTFFGTSQPVELDIGCGRGLFTFTSATQRPEVNILGVELDFVEGRRGARRLHKRDFPNARIIGGDVRQFLTHYVTPHSVAAAHVYFPDPWWKHKHRRRRLFTDEFADQLAGVVMGGGFLHSWTDVQDYFLVIQSLMDHHPLFDKLPPPEERPPENDMDYHTSFERRKRQDGLPIYRGLWRRRELA